MSDAPLSEDEYRAELARTMTEEQLQRAVLGCAEFLGWRVYHTHDSRRSHRGFPDLTLANGRQGRLIFAELKREKGRTKPEQEAWIDELAQVAAGSGGKVGVFLWRPSDWHTGRIEAILRGDDEGGCDG